MAKYMPIPIGNGMTIFKESEAFEKGEEIVEDSFLRITRQTLEERLSKGFKYRNDKYWKYTVGPILYQSGLNSSRCICSYGIYDPSNKKIFHVVFIMYKDGDEESGIPKNSWEVRFSSEESLMPTFGWDEYHDSVDKALSSALSHVQQFCTLALDLCRHAHFSGLVKL